MNKYIYAEFLFSQDDIAKGMSMLSELGSDFIASRSHEYDIDFTNTTWLRVSGKLNSVSATAITLSNGFLSERMRTSHIPSSLKDMYRKR